MKKTVLFLILAAGLFACSKEPVQQEKTSAVEPLKFEINVADIKAAKSAWAEGDVIYVFFQSFSNKYLTLTCEADGSWTDSFVGELTAADLTGGLGAQTLTAVYFPVEVDVDYEAGQFSFSKNGGPVYGYYLFDKDREYEVDGTTVRATLQMQKPANVALFHVAGIQESVDDYTFGCTLVRPVACASVGTDGSVIESVLQDGTRLSGVADGDGVIFAGRLTTTGSADYKFTLASDTQIYTLARTGKTLTAGKMYNFPALTETGGDNWAVTNASDLYVDLGLPSGLKWAKCNLGATSETDYGDYFAWGELQPKDKYADDWSNYLFGKVKSFAKYTGSDYDTLLPEDDAAYGALGGKFRMPTQAEIQELADTKNNTTDYFWTWCDGNSEKYNESTTPGWKIVRNSTSATLFLPAAGRRSNASSDGLKTKGYYWSSSHSTSRPQYARNCTLSSNSASSVGNVRYYGFSVRPVCD